MLKLVIGNANYSSWSFRGWFFLRESGLDFEEIRIPMFTPAWKERLATYTPAGRVPVLIDGEEHIWDTMAIIETVIERYGSKVGWPEEPVARAHARSVAAEMHAGFTALRDELPVNIRARCEGPQVPLSPGCQSDIARIESIFTHCRSRHRGAGPWLFGPFSVADIVFAPVVARFTTYGIGLRGAAGEYCAMVLAHPTVKNWIEKARAEPETITFIEEYLGASRT